MNKGLKIIFIYTFIVSSFPLELARALPAGEKIIAGTASFEKVNDATLEIKASDQSIIEYASFNIASNENVNFSLPTLESISLNRVLDKNSTQILGKLTANGHLILVNENGFYLGEGSHIEAGGIMVAAHDIKNADFLAGRYIFSGTQDVETSRSFISNNGYVKTNGEAIFIADGIRNKGAIEASLGTVALVAGKVVTVGISPNNLISIGIDEPTAAKIVDRDGKPVTDQIKNTGTLSAPGGKVLLNAQSVHDVVESAINLEGVIRADTVVAGKDGTIEIIASHTIQMETTMVAKKVEVNSKEDILIKGPTGIQAETTLKAVQDITINGPTETKGETTLQAGEDIVINSPTQTEGKTTFEAGQDIAINSATHTKGDTAFEANKDIEIKADVTTDSGNLAFVADHDSDGQGAFLQAPATTIKTTTYGDIFIQSSGKSTLGNIISAGSFTLKQSGGEVKGGQITQEGNYNPEVWYTQLPNSVVTLRGSIIIGKAVTLSARDVEYSVGKDWVNSGTFIPGKSKVTLIGPSEARVLGDNSFYDLTVEEPAKSVCFEAGKTQEIVGSLVLKGKFGSPININSTKQNIPWKLSLLGNYTVDFVRIQNTTNVNIHGPPIAPLHTQNLLGNEGFDFTKAGPLWTGSKDSQNWSDPKNWDTGFTPGAGDIVRLDNTSSFDSRIDSSFAGTVAGLKVGSGYKGTLYFERSLSLVGLEDSVISGHLKSLQDISLQSISKITFTKDIFVEAKNIHIEGDVINRGFMSTFDEGKIDLVGKTILQEGILKAPGGKVTITGEYVGISGLIEAKSLNHFKEGIINVHSIEKMIITKEAVLNVSGVGDSSAGKIQVFSNKDTIFEGKLLAQGGDEGGDGGFIEVSGDRVSSLGSVDAQALHGKIGTFLLDPHSITIATGGSGALTDVDQFSDTPASDVTIDPTTINAAGANVVLQTNTDITFSNAISITTAGVTLTAQAGRAIIINANITTNNAAIVLTANETTANGVVNANRDSGTAAITMAAGTTINAGNANITLTVSTGAGLTDSTSGNITIENLTTTGHVLMVNNGPTFGSSIVRASSSSLITASSATLDVNGAGGGGSVGTSASPMRIAVSNVEGRGQLGGVFYTSPTLAFTVGGASLGGLTGISATQGGAITLVSSANSITISEAVSSDSGTITLTPTGATSDLTVNATVSSKTGIITGTIGRNIILGSSAIVTGNETSSAVSLTATAGAISDSSSSDLTASTANIQVTGNAAGVTLTASNTTNGSIGAAGTGRIDIAYSGPFSDLILNAGVNDQVKILQGGQANLDTLTVTARQNTTQSIDFDSGMGINTYSIATGATSITLTSVQTTGLNFSFTAATGTLNVTSVNTDAGTVTLTASAGDVNLGSTAITTANRTTSAVSITSTANAITDSSSSDLTATTANIILTGANARATLTASSTSLGNIGDTGTGRIDLAYSGPFSELVLNAGLNDRVRILQGSQANLDTLTVTARVNTIQTIDFDSGMGLIAYTVTGSSGAMTLTNVQTTGLNFSFTAAMGDLNVTSLNTTDGTVSLTASAGNINLGSTAITTANTTTSAVTLTATLGSIFDSSGSDLTATTANIIVTGNNAGVTLTASAGVIGNSGTGRIDISYQGINSDLIMNAGGNNRVKLLRNGSDAFLDTLTLTARANTTQTIDFDSGLGITTYSVSGSSGQETLTNIQTTGIAFTYTLSTGNLNVTSLNTDAGTITMTVSAGNFNLGSSAITTASTSASAVSLTATLGAINDTSGSDLTATTANIILTGSNAGTTLRASSGVIGGSGTGRIDISYQGANSDLIMNAGGNNQVKLLRNGSDAFLDTLTITARANTTQTIDFDSGLGLIA